ncbi:MAG TPA: hypothetical protein VJH88_05040 [Candidatus Nanoarchaeia archaeon]|nr:hypothetical protein [Candidatus Nanoarchaeia archaeon]
MKHTLRNVIASAAVIAALYSAPRAEADGSVEVAAGHKSTAIDLKATSEVAPRITLFGRYNTTTDYHNNVNHFGLLNGSILLIDGIEAVAQAQFITDVGVVPRAGIDGYISLGDFNLFAVGTVKCSKDTDAECVASVEYRPKINESWSGVFRAENISNFGKDGHTFSMQQLRTGLKHDSLEFGVAGDLFEAKRTLEHSVGGYIKIDF